MSKIKFNEGGQPFYLDDFELLQDNQDKILKTMVKCLCNGKNVLIDGGELTYTEPTNDEEKICVSGGKAFINGEIVEWEDLEMVVPSSVQNLYLHVEKEDEDLRDFENGTQQKCREKYKVTLRTNRDNAWGYIDIFDPVTFIEQLKSVLDLNKTSNVSWTPVKTHEANGTTSKFEIAHITTAGLVQIKCRIELLNSNWGQNENRTIFYWSDEPLGQSLVGKYSPAIFIGDDGKIYSDIIEWSYVDSNQDRHIRLLDSSGSPVTHDPNGTLEGIFYIKI